MTTQKPWGMLVKSAFALFGFAAFCLVADFLLPVLISIAFSYLLYPIVRALEKSRGDGTAVCRVRWPSSCHLSSFFFL